MLIQKWHPVTHDMGLIDASPGGVLRELLAWHSSIGIEHDVREIHSLEDGLEGLLPLSISHHRRLLVPTRSGWTAYFATGIQGSDPFVPVTGRSS